jgi:hypothetical protein
MYGIPHDELPMQKAEALEALPRCSQCHDAPVDEDGQLCEECEDSMKYPE